MAISFARFEFVKRSEGKTACGKAAYNARCRLYFEGNKFLKARLYDWSYRIPSAYHEIILPSYVDPAFRSPEFLWNAAERKEIRRNSQTAFVMVLALPDDPAISIEKRILLARSFAKIFFIEKGFGAQLDIHAPDESRDSALDGHERNWHAHFIITTRRFKEDGLSFEERKPREVAAVIRRGQVISGCNWGALWTAHQNALFESEGLSLRVDWDGIVAQKHLGPVRMRAKASSTRENQAIVALNKVECQNPERILSKIVSIAKCFSSTDFERFLGKYVEEGQRDEVRDAFWAQSQLVELCDPLTGDPSGLYSTLAAVEEEGSAAEAFYRFFQSAGLRMRYHRLSFNIASWKRSRERGGRHFLIFTRGFSDLIIMNEICQSAGYRFWLVIPDRYLSKTYRGQGFSNVESISRFLYSYHSQNREIRQGEEILAIDELENIPTHLLLEILEISFAQEIQLVFSDSSYKRYMEKGRLLSTCHYALP